MFTGIIEEIGVIESPGPRLRVACREVVSGATPGGSIAVNGVCLTALDITSDGFSADLAPETLARTNLGALIPGSVVNLERPLRLADRLSGHIVQGHVDGTATLERLEELRDGNWWLDLRIPPELDQYLVFKGSIAVDGISLTIARLEGPLLGITIIPHTYTHTNLPTRRPGDRLNIECDVLAKHVEKLLGRISP